VDTGSKAVKPKELRWIGSAREDVRSFPKAVKQDIGEALFSAQIGREHSTAQALQGFGGRTVLEIVSDFNTDTWRTVYTVRLGAVVYVLHAFQKKAKKGISTPKKEMDLVKNRLKLAVSDYERRLKDDKERH
jgi:phage-related protein